MMEPTLSRQEFWRHYAPAAIRRRVQAAAVCGYFSAAMTTLGAMTVNSLLLVDALLMLLLSLGMHLGKSRVCSVALCAYFIFSKVMQFQAGGGFGGTVGVVVAIAFISGTQALFGFYRLWEEYRSGRWTPPSAGGEFWENP